MKCRRAALQGLGTMVLNLVEAGVALDRITAFLLLPDKSDAVNRSDQVLQRVVLKRQGLKIKPL